MTKPDNFDRFLAKFIDLLLAGLLYLLPGYMGFLFAVTYILMADGIMEGRSVGKLVCGLRVVDENGAGITFKQSFMRNSNLAFPFILLPIPYFGKPLFFLVLVAVVAIEGFSIVTKPQNRRIGDILAATEVVKK